MRSAEKFRRFVIGAAAAVVLTTTLGAAPAHADTNPYERGPAPTAAGIEGLPVPATADPFNPWHSRRALHTHCGADDLRCSQFLCPAPQAGGAVNEYRATCPY